MADFEGRFVAVLLRETPTKLIKQFASSLWINSLEKSTCIKPVQNLQQSCYHQARDYNHPDIGLLTARRQALTKLATTCSFLAVLWTTDQGPVVSPFSLNGG